MLEPLLGFLLRHRTATLIAALALLLVGAVSAARLTVNDSSERWLPASSIAMWRRFEKHCDYGDTLAVGVQFHRPVRDDDVELLESMRGQIADIEGVAQAIDVSRVAGQIEGATLTEFLRLPDVGEPDPYATYRGVLFDDPRMQAGGAAETEGRTLLTFVEVSTVWAEELDGQERQEELDRRRRHVVEGIYRVLDEHARDDVTYHVTGAVVIQHELERIAREEILTTIPAAGLLIVLVLGIGFRSPGAVAVVLLGGLWGVTVMLGGVGFAGWTLNVVTVGGPTLMSVIVVTSTIHFVHYYAAHGTANGPPRNGGPADHADPTFGEAPHFIRWVAVPCLGVAVVTGVGFLMLTFNELHPARELGIELFAGAILAFFGAYIVWLWIHPLKAGQPKWLTAAAFRRYYGWLGRRPWTGSLLVVALMGAAAVAALRVRIDVDPFSFFHPDSKIARAFDHFSERQFGLYLLDVLLVPRDQPEDEEALAVARAEDRRVALELQRKLEKRPEVRNVISAVDLLGRATTFDVEPVRLDWYSPVQLVKQAREAGLQTWESLREGKGLGPNPFKAWRDFSESLAAYKRALVFFTTFRSWTEDKAGMGALRISFMVNDSGEGYGPLVEALERELERPEIADRFECLTSGTAANVVTLSENLVGGIVWGLGAAVVVMSALCLALFRSVRLTLVSVLPNALPIVMVFGVMGLFGVPLNSGSAMVSTIALGIALNDTIHFTMHYRRRRMLGETTDEALADTFAALGRPLMMTSLVSCLGFAIFLLSDFRPMYHFGMLASLSMLAALLGDMVLLPSLLKLADRGRPA